SAVDVRRGCNGTCGKYNLFSRSQARRWARHLVRTQSMTSYPLAARRLASAVPQEPAPMTATRVLCPCSNISPALRPHSLSHLKEDRTIAYYRLMSRLPWPNHGSGAPPPASHGTNDRGDLQTSAAYRYDPDAS